MPEDDHIESIINIGQLHLATFYSHPLAPTISNLISHATQLNELKRDVAQLIRPGSPTDPNLTADHLEQAFRICVMFSQEESFPRKRKALLKGAVIPRDSTLRRVGPYVCENDDLLKVDGRLEHAELPARTRHPIIIATDHPLAKLIINDRHLKIHHAGVEHTLSVVREQFYLLQGRRAIRRTLARCEPCKIQCSLPKPPRMANLPKERLEAFIRVFTNVGLDCFGPFSVVIGRRSSKRYGLLPRRSPRISRHYGCRLVYYGPTSFHFYPWLPGDLLR